MDHAVDTGGGTPKLKESPEKSGGANLKVVNLNKVLQLYHTVIVNLYSKLYDFVMADDHSPRADR